VQEPVFSFHLPEGVGAATERPSRERTSRNGKRNGCSDLRFSTGCKKFCFKNCAKLDELLL